MCGDSGGVLCPQQEVQSLHQRVAVRLSELESKIISGESTQSTVRNTICGHW